MSFNELSSALFDVCLNAFGEVIQYLPQSREPFELTVVFIKEYQLIQENEFDSVVSSTAPVVEVATKDFKETPVLGERVYIRGQHYRIVEVQPNGVGQMKLILKRQE